jgi:hypothetical protein
MIARFAPRSAGDFNVSTNVVIPIYVCNVRT